jgi:hypothetical protein
VTGTVPSFLSASVGRNIHSYYKKIKNPIKSDKGLLKKNNYFPRFRTSFTP